MAGVKMGMDACELGRIAPNTFPHPVVFRRHERLSWRTMSPRKRKRRRKRWRPRTKKPGAQVILGRCCALEWGQTGGGPTRLMALLVPR